MLSDGRIVLEILRKNWKMGDRAWDWEGAPQTCALRICGWLTCWMNEWRAYINYSCPVFFFFFLDFFKCLFERDREREHERERGRERGRQNPKQAPGSELSAQSPRRGSNPRTVRSWPVLSQTLNRLSHPGAPALKELLKHIIRAQTYKIWSYYIVLALILNLSMCLQTFRHRYWEQHLQSSKAVIKKTIDSVTDN